MTVPYLGFCGGVIFSQMLEGVTYLLSSTIYSSQNGNTLGYNPLVKTASARSSQRRPP